MTDLPEPKKHKRGEVFEVKLFFDAPLPHGEFPIAYLIGPTDHFEERKDMKLIGTLQTINPERLSSDGFRLTGTVPKDAIPGLYEIDRVDIFYSITGMDYAIKKHTILADKLRPFAIIVDKVAGDVAATPSIFHIE